MLLSEQNVICFSCILEAMISQQSFPVFSKIIWHFLALWKKNKSYCSNVYFLWVPDCLKPVNTMKPTCFKSVSKINTTFIRCPRLFWACIWFIKPYRMIKGLSLFFPTLAGWRDTEFSQTACIYNSIRLGKIIEVIVVRCTLTTAV